MPKETPQPKPKGKPNKKALLIAGGIAVAFAAWYVLRKRKQGEGKATPTADEGLTNQSFIPVIGEHTPGAGASYYPSGSSNNEGLILSFLREQQSEVGGKRSEERAESREFYEKIISLIPTGGGAQSSPAPAGSTAAPPPQTQPGPSAPAGKCPSEFPNYNPAGGPIGKRSCYKYSRERCPNKAYPYKHVYWDGHVVCSPV